MSAEDEAGLDGVGDDRDGFGVLENALMNGIVRCRRNFLEHRCGCLEPLEFVLLSNREVGVALEDQQRAEKMSESDLQRNLDLCP